MAIFTTAGSKFYIGGPLEPNFGADLTVANFAGQVWTQVEPLEALGALGDTANAVTFATLSDGRLRKLKGVRDAGTMEIVAAIDYGNAGQIAMLAAEAEDYNYAFRLVFNDAPPGGTPSERLFVGMVMSASEQLDTVDSVMKANFSVAVNSNVVRVGALVSGAAPDNTVLPAITGTAAVGSTLTLSNGTWTGTPTPDFTRQWFADGEGLPGATGTTLVLTSAHLGKVISGMVTARNHLGSRNAMSAATSAVTS